MKWPKLKRDHKGLSVVTLVPLQSGMLKFPAGTRCKVTEAYGGLSLETEKCACCGVSIFIRKVPYAEVVLCETSDTEERAAAACGVGPNGPSAIQRPAPQAAMLDNTQPLAAVLEEDYHVLNRLGGALDGCRAELAIVIEHLIMSKSQPVP
jgi:hypothetical protein